ncbi:hypothetical protein P4O66_022306 [Electrophorus voltai]|uniref:Uncharacterized protein n=1 Tax=Electrophorus voltai TaxID=2609070 RepID=A0AAD8ZQF3_9TELE|nr:hypothetical protein P4O66_022306 [Electrophorus voltai]
MQPESTRPESTAPRAWPSRGTNVCATALTLPDSKAQVEPPHQSPAMKPREIKDRAAVRTPKPPPRLDLHQKPPDFDQGSLSSAELLPAKTGKKSLGMEEEEEEEEEEKEEEKEKSPRSIACIREAFLIPIDHSLPVLCQH